VNVEGKPPEFVVAKNERMEREEELKQKELERDSWEEEHDLAAKDLEFEDVMQEKFKSRTNGSLAGKFRLRPDVLMTDHRFEGLADRAMGRDASRHLHKRNVWRERELEVRAAAREFKKAREKEVKLLAGFRKDVRVWDRMKGKLDRILKNHGVEREVHSGHSFTGGMCKKMCLKIDAIMDDTVKLVRDEYARDRDEMPWRAKLEDVELKMKEFAEVFKQLGAIDLIMGSTEQLSEAEVDEFEELVKRFADKYVKLRKEGGYKNPVTPKLHGLVHHAPAQVRRFGGLGRHREDPGERHHKVVARFMRDTRSVKGWDRRIEAIGKKQTALGIPSALAQTELVEEKGKREFSSATQEKRKAKEIVKKRESADFKSLAKGLP
jgi:hypothetical protein